MQYRRNVERLADLGETGPGHVGRLGQHLPGLAVCDRGTPRDQDKDVIFDEPFRQGDVPVILRDLRVVAANHTDSAPDLARLDRRD